MVKNLLAIWETPATHSSILAWRIPWIEEPGGLHSLWDWKESDTTERVLLLKRKEIPAEANDVEEPRELCDCSVAQSRPARRLHGLQPARLLCPRDSPGENTGAGGHALLQGVFLTQGSNPHLLHWQACCLLLSHLGIMLSEINQTQEGTYYMVPLVCSLEKSDLKDR